MSSEGLTDAQFEHLRHINTRVGSQNVGESIAPTKPKPASFPTLRAELTWYEGMNRLGKLTDTGKQRLERVRARLAQKKHRERSDPPSGDDLPCADRQTALACAWLRGPERIRAIEAQLRYLESCNQQLDGGDADPIVEASARNISQRMAREAKRHAPAATSPGPDVREALERVRKWCEHARHEFWDKNACVHDALVIPERSSSVPLLFADIVALAALAQSDALSAWSEQDAARDAVRPDNAQSDAQPEWDCTTQGCKYTDTIDGLLGCCVKYRAKIRELEGHSDAQPVGWLVSHPSGYKFASVDETSARDYCAKHPAYSVEPLYAAPPLHPDAVREALEKARKIVVTECGLFHSAVTKMDTLIDALSASAPSSAWLIEAADMAHARAMQSEYPQTSADIFEFEEELRSLAASRSTP
jgi:hypothetical protein